MDSDEFEKRVIIDHQNTVSHRNRRLFATSP
jgi:hypothetical protein